MVAWKCHRKGKGAIIGSCTDFIVLAGASNEISSRTDCDSFGFMTEELIDAVHASAVSDGRRRLVKLLLSAPDG